MTSPESAPPGFARGYADFPGRIGRTMSESTSWWPPEPEPHADAPNIIVVVVDDLGYSDIGPFGGEIPTPNLDALAARGVTFGNYHTTPVCSPARAALLTGLNPHRAGFAHVAGFDPGFPNYTMEIAEDVLTLPEVLRENGYATYAIGKWHLSREDLLSDAAARRSWPCQRGFDRYYGSLEGFTSFFAPNRLTRDNSPVVVDRYPDDYYLTDDLTDEAVGMIHGLRADDADKPFFLYFAHHAVHAPLAASAAAIADFRGRYDAGWDALRQSRFRRQLELGLFPAETRLPSHDDERARYRVPAWETLGAEERERAARHMEVYAAMVESIDASLGRVLEAVAAHGELDNTIVVFTSDNGGSAEGGPLGTRSYLGQFIHDLDLPEAFPRDQELDIDLVGGPRSMCHYPRGWAAASNTPFRYFKGSTFAGGVRTPLIVSWPRGLGDQAGSRRDQFVYVTDLMPTILGAAGVETPSERCGRPAKHVDGVSFEMVLADGAHPPTRREQYAELGGHRGLYADGWKILTLHAPGAAFEDAEWQLFDLAVDPTETTDVAAQHPELTRDLAARWERAAWANTVLPLNDGSGIMQHRTRSGRVRRSEAVRLFSGTPPLERVRCIDLIRLRTVTVTARVDHQPGAAGVLLSHGDQGGGYLLYIEDGRVRLAYNEYGRMHELAGPAMTAGGPWSVRLELRARPDFRWAIRLGAEGPEGPAAAESLDVEVFMMLGMAPFTGISVARDAGGPVSWAVHERHGSFPYSGRLHHVDIVPGPGVDYDPGRLHRAEALAAAAYD